MIELYKTLLNSAYGEDAYTTDQIKMVIGFWANYFIGKVGNAAAFKIGNQTVIINDNKEGLLAIHHKQMTTLVLYEDIRDILDLYEIMLKAAD